MKKLFLSLAIICSLTTALFAQQGLQKVRIDDFSGGMNSRSVVNKLEPNVAASVVNVDISRPGELSTRKGESLFVRDVGSTFFRGLGRFDPDMATSYLVAASRASVISALSTDTQWRIENSSKDLTEGQDTQFVQADKVLFVLNGQDNTSWWDGTVYNAGGTYPTSPPKAKYGAWLKNYLFLAGEPTQLDWVYFSNNLVPTVFSATDIIKINTGDGQAIQWLEPFRIDEVIVYKERSVFLLDTTSTSDPLDADSGWTVQPISKTIGLIAPRSVVNIGNDHWFLSSNPIAVRSLARSEFDKILVDRVSDPIQDVFDGTGSLVINQSKIQKAAAILFDNKYIIAIPTGTSAVNNTVFVFDFLINGWYRIDGWYPTNWLIFDERLFFTDANDGRVMEAFANNTGDFVIGPSNINSANPDQPICFEYLSREIDFTNQEGVGPENFKMPDAIEVEFEPTGNYDAIVYVNVDQNGWASVGSVNLAGNSLTLPVTLPATIGNGGVSRKTFQIQSKNEFRRIQIRIRQCGLSQQVKFRRATIFARPKKWRREN